MKRLLILALGAAIATAACGTTAADATDSPLASGNGPAAGPAVTTGGGEHSRRFRSRIP